MCCARGHCGPWASIRRARPWPPWQASTASWRHCGGWSAAWAAPRTCFWRTAAGTGRPAGGRHWRGPASATCRAMPMRAASAAESVREWRWPAPFFAGRGAAAGRAHQPPGWRGTALAAAGAGWRAWRTARRAGGEPRPGAAGGRGPHRGAVTTRLAPVRRRLERVCGTEGCRNPGRARSVAASACAARWGVARTAPPAAGPGPAHRARKCITPGRQPVAPGTGPHEGPGRSARRTGGRAPAAGA